MPGSRREPLSRHRSAVAAAMSASAVVPQFPLYSDVDASAIEAVRRDFPFTYTDVIIGACAAALRRHPDLNAAFDDDAVVYFDDINIGLVVEAKGELIVVVIRSTDALSLADLAAERLRLTSAANEGRLRGDDVFGATFVISNLGPAGVSRFQALLFPPAAAILAVGAAGDRPVVADGRLVVRRGFTLCLTCDHRVLGGLTGAAFLRAVVELLNDRPWLESIVNREG